jgi:hypothetical protein
MMLLGESRTILLIHIKDLSSYLAIIQKLGKQYGKLSLFLTASLDRNLIREIHGLLYIARCPLCISSLFSYLNRNQSMDICEMN